MRARYTAIVTLFVACILFVCTFAEGQQQQPTCWIDPGNLNCSDPSDPGPVGNLAFLALQFPSLWKAGVEITDAAQAALGPAWLSTVSPIDYHVSISYMYCAHYNDTQRIHAALRTFDWQPVHVTLDHVQCEPGYLEMALSNESQSRIALFFSALRAHLNSAGIDVPDRTAWQPPFHITLGSYNQSLVAVSDWNLPSFPADLASGVNVTFNVFYFGKELYVADQTNDNNANHVVSFFCFAAALSAATISLLFW